MVAAAALVVASVFAGCAPVGAPSGPAIQSRDFSPPADTFSSHASRAALTPSPDSVAPPGAPTTPSPDLVVPSTAPSALRSFINGVDVSFLQQIEEHGGAYYESGAPQDALEIFKHHGVNCVRLRVWNAPASGYNDLAHTLEMAARVKSLGMALLIDLHYSDTWADPGRQTKPAAWAGLPFEGLEKAVHDYTKEVVAELKEQGTPPDIIQIGNEITSGFLWDDGRVGGKYDSNWPNFAALLKAAIRGVRDACAGCTASADARGEARSSVATVAVMLHVDAGGNNATCRWFFDRITEQEIPFDIIGLSYYSWWHGSLANLRDNMDDLAVRYGKPIVIVETAYPWTLASDDGTPNLVGESWQLENGFPATVEGQLNFLTKEKSIIMNLPLSKGAGMFYWAPEYMSVPGLGSVWENVTLFDFKGGALRSLDVFSSGSAVAR